MNAGGAELLDRLAAFIRRFLSITPSQLNVLALWVMHTHCFESAEATPYLSVTSAEKESGKTRLLEVLQFVVSRPWFTGRVTAAVLARKVDAETPTLLLDESDAAFNGPQEYSEALRGLLNSGYRRGGCTSLCVGHGASMSYKDFRTFCPKVIAGIGKLPDTVASRSIPIRVKRKAPGEDVERFRYKDVLPEAQTFSGELAEWAQANQGDLEGAHPELPPSLSDRHQDVIEPLLAIADRAGGSWPTKARDAVVELLTGNAAEDESTRVRLLADIRNVFLARPTLDRLSSRDLLTELLADEASPWAEVSNGKPLTLVALARFLKPFEIAPRTIKLDGGTTAKGYFREGLADAFVRYLPHRTTEPSPASPSSVYKGPLAPQQPSPECVVTDTAATFSAADARSVTPVTARSLLEDGIGTARRHVT